MRNGFPSRIFWLGCCMMIDLILSSLPEDIFNHILVSYWKTTDLMNLDLALFKHHRKHHEELLGRLKQVLLTGGGGDPIHRATIKWLTLRGVHVAHMKLGHCIVVEDLLSIGPRFAKTTSIEFRDFLPFSVETVDDEEDEEEHMEQLRVQRLANIQTLSPYFSNIRSLSFTGTVAGMGNRTFVEITKYCTQLKELKLVQVRIMDESVVAILRDCRRLESLGLWACQGLSNVSLFAMAEYCRGLKHLEINMGSKLSDSGFQAVAERCREIQSLHLCLLRSVTDITIKSIIKTNRQLSSLLLNRCDALTDASIHALIRHCPQLKVCTLLDCKGISEIAILMLRQHLARLNF